MPPAFLKEGLLAGATGNDSCSIRGRCPVAEFRVPDVFKKHPGGQDHLQLARTNTCAGLLALTYHMGLDMDGIIEQTTKSYGMEVPVRGPLFDEIHDMVRRVKEQHKAQKCIFQVWCLAISFVLPVAFTMSLVTLGAFPSVVVCFVFEMYFLNVFHVRHHKGGNLYSSARLNTVLNPIYNFIDCTWGYHPLAWRQNHHVNHHMHTNNDGADPDLPASYPIIRLFEAQERRWFHKFQTLYWPLLLPFSVVRFPVSNLLEHGGHPLYFVIWVILMWITPIVLHGAAGLVWTCMIQALVGVAITYKFAVSHAHVDNAPKQLEPKQEVCWMTADEFVIDQVQESMSWGGYWSCFLFGGINLQIEHHLAPALEPTLLACIAPELRRICEKHGIKYISEPTLFHAMAKFHLRLWMSG
mmetsp:Transcript_52893/g.163675  ORF Transcript_52893/g.163675 Transcript_52893/m.163675 type:complete len:411 (+) Transcript_52893:65-1297(+)